MQIVDEHDTSVISSDSFNNSEISVISSDSSVSCSDLEEQKDKVEHDPINDPEPEPMAVLRSYTQKLETNKFVSGERVGIIHSCITDNIRRKSSTL